MVAFAHATKRKGFSFSILITFLYAYKGMHASRPIFFREMWFVDCSCIATFISESR